MCAPLQYPCSAQTCLVGLFDSPLRLYSLYELVPMCDSSPMLAWALCHCLVSTSSTKGSAMHLQVNEAELRSVLSPAGFVWELKVPRSSDGTSSPLLCQAACLEDCVLITLAIGSLALPLYAVLYWYGAAVGLKTEVSSNAGQARGFAFAGFMCRAHAEKAITVANGQVSTPELPSSPSHACRAVSNCLTLLSVAALVMASCLGDHPAWWRRAPAVLRCAPHS